MFPKSESQVDSLYMFFVCCLLSACCWFQSSEYLQVFFSVATWIKILIQSNAKIKYKVMMHTDCRTNENRENDFKLFYSAANHAHSLMCSRVLIEAHHILPSVCTVFGMPIQWRYYGKRCRFYFEDAVPSPSISSARRVYILPCNVEIYIQCSSKMIYTLRTTYARWTERHSVQLYLLAALCWNWARSSKGTASLPTDCIIHINFGFWLIFILLARI